MTHRITANSPFGLRIDAHSPDDDIRDLDVETLRAYVSNERLLILRGFRTFADADALSVYCERWGEVSVWPFGTVLELVESDAPEDHIFGNSQVPLHWDGMYRPQVPELQIFHCVRAPRHGQGGRTIFSDTVRALESASAPVRALWARVTGTYRRKMAFYDSVTVAPVIDTHPFRGYPVIRYNEPPFDEGAFLNPPDLAFSGLHDSEKGELFRSLHDALRARANLYAHAWQSGDVVIADNFSLLHGREAFETRAPRHIQRVHVLSTPPLQNPRLVSYA